VAVAHYTWQFDSLRDPAPVFLPIKFDRQFHPFIIRPPRERPPTADYPRMKLPRYPSLAALIATALHSFGAAGNADYMAATPVDQSFQVLP
jgi:hypothetical protein